MKNNIKAVLVDDEIDALENLRYLLNLYFPEITIIGEATYVDEAVKIINNTSPDVVFLDIEMPEKNGFHLIREFSEVNFHIVFITAYNHYAIKAFQIAALDYLLKPIDIDLLANAIKKITRLKNTAERLQVLEDNKNEIHKIIIPFNKDYIVLNLKNIICIEADRMYTNIHTTSGKQYVAAKKLIYYENLLKDCKFIRVHRSWLVNVNHIKFYYKTEKLIGLTNSKKVPLGTNYKNSITHFFKI